jgi:hypothetical protein
MKIIFNLLLLALLLAASDSYEKIETNKYNINIRTTLEKGINQNLNIFFNEKLIKKYNFEGSVPSLKFIVYEKKESYLGILIGWRNIHRGLGINGEYYKLDIFKVKDNNSIIPVNILSKNGFDGQSEEGNEVFKYKTKEYAMNYISNILGDIEKNLEKNSINLYSLTYFKSLKNWIPISKVNLIKYTNIAYYLEKAKAYKESIYLLEKILAKYPKRTVAYLNIADAYWGDKNKNKAIENYKIYVKQMKDNGKEKKIPKKVFERINAKDINKKVIYKNIKIEKQYLFDNPNKDSKTKMYLLKGDKIEIIKEENNWLYILYKGKKDIKKWIPKSAIEEIKPISKNIEIKKEKSLFTKLLEYFNLSKVNQNIYTTQS